MKRYTVYYGSVEHEVPWEADMYNSYKTLHSAVFRLTELHKMNATPFVSGYVFDNVKGKRCYTIEVGYVRTEADMEMVKEFDQAWGWE